MQYKVQTKQIGKEWYPNSLTISDMIDKASAEKLQGD